jgi:3-isopropylmalate dehydrogenase
LWASNEKVGEKGKGKREKGIGPQRRCYLSLFPFPFFRWMSSYRIAVIPGDGIGPEVVGTGFRVIEAAADMDGIALRTETLPYSADHYLKTGETLPEAGFNHLRDETDAIFVGALGDPRVPGNEHARDILLGLRFRLDLYINFRPVRLLHPRLSPLKNVEGRVIDFVIFRENTEGQYQGMGRSERVGTPDERQISEEIHTRKGVRRIIEAAFAWGKAHGKTRITMSDKSNAVPFHRLWGEIFADVGKDYPDLAREHRYVDALALELVREPERFQIIVTNNLYGDILSDLGAGLVGGLGVAASANLHPGRPGLFEPVHGSAPALAGRNVANPIAAVLTGALMLESLGHPGTARRLERAVVAVLADGPATPDIGGNSGTREVGRALEEALRC